MTGHLGKELRYCCTSRDLISYWQERYHWTSAQAATLDSIATHAVASKLGPAATRRILKLRCGWLPVNDREARHDPDQPPGCSACSNIGLVPETVDHIFQCTASSRRIVIRDHFSRFHSKLREHKTNDCIISAIQTGAIAWIDKFSVVRNHSAI